jgi:hypothetical protein
MLHVDTFATQQWHCLPGLYRLKLRWGKYTCCTQQGDVAEACHPSTDLCSRVRFWQVYTLYRQSSNPEGGSPVCGLPVAAACLSCLQQASLLCIGRVTHLAACHVRFVGPHADSLLLCRVFLCAAAIAAVTCPAAGAPSVDNGAFTCGADAKPGDACVAKCADGYVGAPRMQCSSTGSWGAVEGSCVQAGAQLQTGLAVWLCEGGSAKYSTEGAPMAARSSDAQPSCDSRVPLMMANTRGRRQSKLSYVMSCLRHLVPPCIHSQPSRCLPKVRPTRTRANVCAVCRCVCVCVPCSQ